MSRQTYVSVLVSLLILATIAFASYRGADALQHSLFTYQSPLTTTQIPLVEPMPPLTRRVVVVIISGLNSDSAWSATMPNLQTLLEVGASAPMVSRPPTYSPSAWTTLMTGVWPDLNNAPIGPVNPEDLPFIKLDHLFAAANDAGLQTVVVGSEHWKPLLSSSPPQASYYVSQADAIADGQVAEASLAFIAQPGHNLILIHFGQMDAVGRSEGTASLSFATTAQQVDLHLRQITRLVNFSESVLIVTSDHGLLADGRSGGGEPDLTELPFVMIGQNVTPGDYSPVRQVDLAPTVATLLGMRLPATAQGRPLYPMLQLDDDTLTVSRLSLAEQKVALSSAYLTVIGGGGLNQSLHDDLATARLAWEGGNQAGALQLAELVSDQAIAEMNSAREARIASERLGRLTVALIVLFLLAGLIWLRRERYWLTLTIGGLVAVAFYYGLFRLGGNTFSLSTIDSLEGFVALLVRYAAIGMGIGGLLVMGSLMLEDERSWPVAVSCGYWYGILAAFVAALPALVGYWQHGTTVRWYLPDLGLVLLHFASLVQVTVIAVLAIPLPWLIALATWGVGRWRARVETRSHELDPMARLRSRK